MTRLYIYHRKIKLMLVKIYVNNSYAANGVILPLVKNMSDLRLTIHGF